MAVIDQLPSVQDQSAAWPRSFCVRHCGLFCAAALAAVAVFFISQASLLAWGSLSLPGPGFFPLVLGVVLLFCSIWIGFGLSQETTTGETHELGHRDVIVAMVAMLLIAPLFESLGAYLTLGAFAFILLVFVARMNVVVAVASSSVGMLAIWYFFQVLLGVQLPKGILLG